MTYRHTIVAIDNVHGHRLMYVRLLLEELRGRGSSATLVIPHGVRAGNELGLHLGESIVLDDKIEIIEMDSISVTSLSVLAASRQDAGIVLPDGDKWIWSTARMRRAWPSTLTLLCMRPTGQSRNRAVRVTQTIAKIALRSAARLRSGVKVLCLVSSLNQSPNRFQVPDPISFSPDPEAVEKYRTEWNAVAPRRHWIGIVGAISPRKNVPLTAKALANLKRRDIGFVVAGLNTSPEDEADWSGMLATAEIPIVRLNHLLTDVELDSIVKALDCVVLAHSNEGSSGIFGKAMAAGTPVVAAGAQTLRVDAKSARHASTWVPLSDDKIGLAIERMLAFQPDGLTPGGTSEGFRTRILGPNELESSSSAAL